jgi:parallel beta-helix repeat protein
MKKIVNSLIVAVLVFGTVQALIPFWSFDVVGPAPPPDDLVDGVQFIDGDWVVTGTEEYTNETIILSGNLTVDPGATLIFNNVTLAMNCSSENGTYEINIWGTWDVSDYDGDTATTYDRSNISDSLYDSDDRSAGDYKFAIKVWEFATLSLEDTDISETGFESSNNNYGIYIERGNNVNIQNCTIENGYTGLYLWRGNDYYISHTEISNNEMYGITAPWVNGLQILNSEIHHNDFGMQLWSDNTVLAGSYIHNNTYTYTSGVDHHGLEIWYSDYLDIYDNVFENNGWAGWSYQVEIYGITYANIYNNTFTKLDDDSNIVISMSNTADMNFYDNRIIKNQGTALTVSFTGTSWNNRFYGNNISHNSGNGAQLWSWGDGSEMQSFWFYDNIMINNTYGLSLYELRTFNVTNNIIIDCASTGVRANDVQNGKFANNTINATDTDILLQDSHGEQDTVLEVVNCSFDREKITLTQSPVLIVSNYLHVYVSDANSWVPGAFVEVKNVTSDIVYTGISGEDGWIRDIELRNETITTTGNTSYDPYNITATLDSYTAYGETEPVMGVSKAVNVSFSGDLPPVPPLGLIAVSDITDVVLNWDPSPSVDKDHYYVYRNNTIGDWQMVYDSSSSPGQELWTNWTDVNAASDWASYRYYVTTIDNVGQESNPSNIARCGDWVVINDRSVADLSTPMNGSLIIHPTANLTLNNVKLQFNSSFLNEFGVEVLPQGKLWLLDNDNDPVTTSDQTYFSTLDPLFSFFFVMTGDEFVMRNSRMDNCGSNQDLDLASWHHELDGPNIMTVGEPSSRGLYISSPGSYIEITDNEFQKNFVTILLNSTDPVSITGNTFSSNVFDIYISDSHNNVITGNTHTNNNGFPIYLLHSGSNTITSNDITNPSGTEAGIAVLYSGCTSNIITGNTFSGGDYGVVATQAGANNNISSNDFGSQARGIYLRYTAFTTLFLNDFDSTTEYDCFLEYSSQNTIMGSTSNNGATGYYLQDSNNVDITDIIVENATNTGVYVFSSNNFQITDSTFKSCNEGLRISEGFTITMENLQIEDCTIGLYLTSNPQNIRLDYSYIGEGTDKAIHINVIDNFRIEECFLNATTLNFYLNDATVTSYNTTFDQTKVSMDTASSIALWWRVKVRVFDWLGDPVSGANVQIREAAGTLIHDLTTDGNGYTAERWILERIQFAFFKESYTPHSFHAQKGTHAGSTGLKLNQSTLVEVILENMPPTVSNVIISPSLPTTVSDLTLSYMYSDDENDPEGSTMIIWYIDGIEDVSFNNLTTIGSSFTSKDETWFCEVIPHDGTIYGPPMTSTPVTIQNTAPVVSNVAIQEATPSSSDDLHVTYDFSDIDGDSEINSQYRWWVDQGAGYVYSGVDSLELSASNTIKGELWKCIITPNDGDDFGISEESNVVVIGNSPPEVFNVVILPEGPTGNDSLSVSYTYFDLDGDLQSGSTIEWYKDGSHQPGLDDMTTVDSSLTQKGDIWHYIITPSDGTDFGAAASSMPVTIDNTPPTVSNIIISPSTPNTLDDLSVTYDFYDYDGDLESLDTVIKWLRWSVSDFFDTGYRGQTLPGEFTAKGESWKCEIIPHDGYNEGTATQSSMSVTIINTAPSASNADIDPPNPTAESNLTAYYDYSDPDSDPQSGSTIRWYKDGVMQTALNDSSQVDFSLTQKGDIWHFVVTPSDGEDLGTPVACPALIIGNTPPTVSNIIIAPSNPITSDELTVSYDFFDLDGDTESLDTVVKWLKWSVSDFFDTGLRGMTLPSEHIQKGEQWKCEVTPHDGTSEGSPTVSSMSVTVGNSAPYVENVVVLPDKADADSQLSTSYDFIDPDMDGESGSTIRWYKDGILQDALNDSMTVDSTLTLKGEIWHYIITPSDGEDVGIPVQSAQLTIGNTPPYVTNITISPTDPDTTMDLSVSYDFYDSDGDLESLDTVVKWLRWDGFDYFDTGHRGKTLSSIFTARAEVWTCEVVPHDGLDEGSPSQSGMNVTIGNTPPQITNAIVTPEDAGSDSILQAVYDYYDIDSDPESGSTIRWYRDGVLQPGLNDSWTVDFSYTGGNDEWYYIITPSDGEEFGSPVQSSSVTIGNSKPQVFNVLISPSDPDTNDDLTVTYNFYDYDGDSESLDTSVRWLKWSGSVFFDSGLRGKTLSSIFTSKGETWKCEVVPHDGAEEGDANQSQNTVTIGNSAPEALNCVVSPSAPDADSELVASYEFSDPDSDLESGTTIQWYKDDVHQPALDDSLTVNYTLTAKGDKWYYIVTPSDGEDPGVPAQSQSVFIGNTQPTVSNIVISPANPITGDDLSVTYDFYDEDGDTESLDTTVRWLKWSGSVFFDSGLRGKNLSSEYTSKGETWSCDVIPHDGLNEGAATRSDMNVTIGNTGPSVPNAYITPAEPAAASTLVATYDFSDPDSDTESGSTISWYRDGVLQPTLNGSFSVDFSLTNGNDQWYYVITPSDGEDIGSPVQSVTVTIGNTPPEAQNIVISPANPDTDDDLTVTYNYYDFDGDSESLDTVVKWLRWSGDVAFDTGLRGKTLSSDYTSRGEIWTCDVIPHDGVDEGGAFRCPGNVTISNSEPSVSNAKVIPVVPDGDSNLTASYDFIDPDSDLESGSVIRWYKDDVEQVSLQGELSVDFTLTSKGEVWYFTITPFDGVEYGSSVQSENVTIGNAPPTVSNIVISPGSPTAEDDITVSYDFYDSDGDSESLDTTIKWLRWNGAFYEDSGYRGQTLSAAYTSKGEIWKCEVRPHDGLDEGEAVISSAIVTITNSRPSASNAYITPEEAQTGSDLEANYDYADLDGDLEVGSEIEWYRDGVHVSDWDNNFTIPSSETVKGQVWNFTIWPFDSTDFGEPVFSSTITIQNTKPMAEDLAINSNPSGEEELQASYRYSDVDSDSQQGFEIKWYRNGIHVNDYDDDLEVDPNETKKGELWYFTIKVYDGEDYSDLLDSFYVEIQNSIPIKNELTPEPGSVQLNETESFEFHADVMDPDGDLLLIKWRLDRNPVGDGEYYLLETDYQSAGTYTLNLTVQDVGENSGTLSWEWQITILDENRDPEIEVREPTTSSPRIKEGDSLRFIIDSSDPDEEDDPQVTWYFDDEVAQSGGDSYTYAADDLAAGNHMIKAVVDDGEDSVEYAWDLSVQDVAEEELMGLSYDAWGLILALISGLAAIMLFLFGLFRVRKKKGALKTYMAEIDEISTTKDDDPVEYDYRLTELEEKINSDFRAGHIEDLHYMMLQDIISSRRGEARKAEISQKFDRLPEGVVKNLDDMLKDGKISKEEYEGFVATISKTTTLSPYEKKELSKMIGKWESEDGSLPDEFPPPPDKPKPKKTDDEEIDEIINTINGE